MAVLSVLFPHLPVTFAVCSVLWVLTLLGLSPIDHLPEDQRCQEGRRGAPAPEE